MKNVLMRRASVMHVEVMRAASRNRVLLTSEMIAAMISLSSRARPGSGWRRRITSTASPMHGASARVSSRLDRPVLGQLHQCADDKSNLFLGGLDGRAGGVTQLCTPRHNDESTVRHRDDKLTLGVANSAKAGAVKSLSRCA